MNIYEILNNLTHQPTAHISTGKWVDHPSDADTWIVYNVKDNDYTVLPRSEYPHPVTEIEVKIRSIELYEDPIYLIVEPTRIADSLSIQVLTTDVVNVVTNKFKDLDAALVRLGVEP